ncbi:MAG TPA: hypothetical protein VN710_09150 [Verrucomicrobiae bacterium]|nr:hypothetical protein [Verrucomicrobiae bacterium]
MRILAVNAGTSFHIESLEGPRYHGSFDGVIRPEDLASVDPAGYGALLIPCRTPAHRLIPHRARLARYLHQGGTVIAMGETNCERWLPGIRFTPLETNWWWWLDPAGDLGVRIAAPAHPLFRHLTQRDLAWHLHGFFDPPLGAEVLAADSEGRALLYIDEVTTRGRLIVTSLDPFYHHGHHFMPATTRFLDGFLPWLVEDLASRARAAAS